MYHVNLCCIFHYTKLQSYLGSSVRFISNNKRSGYFGSWGTGGSLTSRECSRRRSYVSTSKSGTFCVTFSWRRAWPTASSGNGPRPASTPHRPATGLSSGARPSCREPGSSGKLRRRLKSSCFSGWLCTRGFGRPCAGSHTAFRTTMRVRSAIRHLKPSLTCCLTASSPGRFGSLC